MTSFVLSVDVCSFGNRQSRCFSIVIVNGFEQWRATQIVWHVHIRAFSNKQFDDIAPPIQHRSVQRCRTPFVLYIDIRAARRDPGLARQHVVCVEAARTICDASCRGAVLGSAVLDFQPGSIRSGDYDFDLGSAGSASLVIQTVLPALFLAGQPSTVTVTGGTYNPMAPPFDFLRETFLPAIATAGFLAECRLIKPGFFPAGGGRIIIDVQPWQKNVSRAIELCKLLEQPHISARIYTARLPAHIARRQKKLLSESGLDFQNIEHVEVTDSAGAGNCVMIWLCSASRTTVFTAFGMRGKPSERVVGEVVAQAKDFLASGAAVDRFLADQILIYMAMNSHFAKDAETGTLANANWYTTNDLSTHLTTNIETIKQFLPIDFKIEPQDRIYRISCAPSVALIR